MEHRNGKRLRAVAMGCALLLGIGQVGAGQNPVFQNRAKERVATVSVLALSNYAHQGFAGNQDVYLADVSLKGGEHETAKLLDVYPGSGNGIRRSILVERQPLRMRLTRTPECDSPARDLLLATRDGNIFDASTRSTIAAQPDANVPCYKVVHESIRLAKK